MHGGQYLFRQECIPVGCVSPASMVISTAGGFSTEGVSAQGIHPPNPKADTSPDPEETLPGSRGGNPFPCEQNDKQE